MKNPYDRAEPKAHQGKSGSWRVRFFDEIENKYREKSCATKTEAENLKRAIIRKDDLSFWFPEKTVIHSELKTYKDLALRWLDHGENVRRLSKSCLKNYQCHLNNHILPEIGDVNLRALKLDHIELVAKAIKSKVPQTRSYQAIRKNRKDDDGRRGADTLSLAYQREILTVACMICSWASKRRPPLIHENPFETFKLPECPEHLYNYWTISDEDKFFDWLDSGANFYVRAAFDRGQQQKRLDNPPELRDIVMVALRTGMRLGEIGALRNADVDLAQGFIIVRGSYCARERIRKNTTKNKKNRRIEINQDVRQILERRMHIPQFEPLFNINMNSIKFFSRTCRWAKVKEIHFHSLRHTCLTNLANGYGMSRSLPLPKVQQIAGHLDIKTTMRYVHNDIIKETASLQWSRSERRAEVITEVRKKEGLRLVSSGKNI